MSSGESGQQGSGAPFRLVRVIAGATTGLTLWFDGEEPGSSLLVVGGRVPLFPAVGDLRAFASAPVAAGGELADELALDPAASESALAAHPAAVDLAALERPGSAAPGSTGPDAIAALDALDMVAAIAAATDDHLAQGLLAGGSRVARLRDRLERSVDSGLPATGIAEPAADVGELRAAMSRLVTLAADDLVVLDAEGLAEAVDDEQVRAAQRPAVRRAWDGIVGPATAGVPGGYLAAGAGAAAFVVIVRLWRAWPTDLSTISPAIVAVIVASAVTAGLVALLPVGLLIGARRAATINRPLLAGATVGTVHVVAVTAWSWFGRTVLFDVMTGGPNSLDGNAFDLNAFNEYFDVANVVAVGLSALGVVASALLAAGFARGPHRLRGAALVVALAAAGSLGGLVAWSARGAVDATWLDWAPVALMASLVIAIALQAALGSSAVLGNRRPSGAWRLAAAGAVLSIVSPAVTLTTMSGLFAVPFTDVNDLVLVACGTAGAASLLLAALRGLGREGEPAGEPPPGTLTPVRPSAEGASPIAG